MSAKIMIAAAMGAVLLTPVASQAAELIGNGGFETGDFTDWTLFGDPVELGQYVAVDTVAPNSGTYGAYFGTQTPGGISQTVSTVAGHTYNISFALQVENVGGGVTPNSFLATFGGATLYTVTNAPEAGYQLFSFTSTATSAATELKFTMTNPPSFFDLDDISVTESAVPEPGVWALMLVGFGLTGATLRRRQACAARA
ncbi:MAG: PEPxxWA-CTERM sorting domain-containing protein [Alphaproteobacteria bacterium]|nr:PEPxxWA-CTERM sorting domain-containing protein [Alphaproteobacteria bacterium]MBU1514131.1 PEPxxWA-CTERM sorting domain-containing protein [Alphaproteobacteria bacterium]MBU2096220.1 PEPxxWA-CTERM sorting domain-containing protein [Alphaproteobacteria bacterium]MBU2151174.1 PEPxxWA-CTERM sorting domain-containing protein [Alphaproteobacteria bacterium]MBU2307167.1 PEPxxWA-CTERM sorting domain-containing protein [Alphaproteobacteria bacterium]